MKEVNVSKLILDYNLYPRREIDSQHVSYMVESLNAGVELPPVVADEKSKRVVDGFHRITAIKRLNKSSGIISVIYKKYKSDADIFVDAMRYNASHGRTLTQYDRTHCIIRGEELHIPKEILASALNLTTVKFGKLHTSRVGKLHSSLEKSSKISTRLIPLKRTIQHKTNSILTDTQEQANIKLSGMHQVFYVNQIILLIESDLLNTADEKLMNRIGVLHELLNKLDADKRIVKSK